MKRNVLIVIILGIGIGIASISTIFWIILSQNGDNKAPVIVNYYPLINPSINDTEIQEFNITAYDPNGHALTYSWYLNGTKVGGNSSSYTFIANSTVIGTSIVIVNITDGDLISSHSWILTVIAYKYEWSAADCPGAPPDITEDQIIKVGVIGDTGRKQGQGSENGALLAAYEINSAGGITIGIDHYYFGVVWENSDEENPILDTAVAVSAANKLINNKQVQFATGSSRTEAALAYQPLFLEKKIIFINTGTANTSLTAPILSPTTYDEYKYYFQISPTNTTALAKNLISLIISTSKTYTALTGHNINRFSFVREALSWTEGFASAMIGALMYYNLTYTGADIAFPLDVSSTEMDAHFTNVIGNNTQIVIPLISGTAGLTFANSYGDLPAKTCIPIGINVLAQDSGFWDETSGRCNYSIGIETVYETDKTTKTLPFWYAYKAKYGTDPVYTATGTYDAFYQLKWMLETSMTLDPEANVATLEAVKDLPGGGMEGTGGWLAYDLSHSPKYGWPFGVGLAVQWLNGKKNFLIAPGLYPSDPYSTILGVPPYGTMLNQTLIKLPPDFYFYD